MAKKDVADMSVEQKLKNLYQLQTMLSEIDKIKTDRIKIQIQFLVLTLLFQGLSFCRTPEFRKNCFLH